MTDAQKSTIIVLLFAALGFVVHFREEIFGVSRMALFFTSQKYQCMAMTTDYNIEPWTECSFHHLHRSSFKCFHTGPNAILQTGIICEDPITHTVETFVRSETDQYEKSVDGIQ